jgi:WD40 repeat protein
MLASGSGDKTIKLWNTNTDDCESTLAGDRGILCVSFSPDSNILAACDDGGNIRLYDPATGEVKSTLSGNEVNTTLLEVDKIIPQEWINGVHYQMQDSDRFERNEICVIKRSDGTWRFGKILEIASEMIYEVYVSNSTTKAGIPGDNVGKIFCPSSRKGCLRSDTVYDTVTWSPDGKSLASDSDGQTVRIWDPSTGQVKWTLPGDKPILCVSFSPNSNILAAGDHDGKIRLYDSATGEVKSTLTGDTPIFCVSFSPDSNVLAACDDGGNIRLYDLATGEVKSTLSGNEVNTTIDALLEVDKIIPQEWINGVHYQVQDSDRFERNEICVIKRSDGTWRFGKILGIESEMNYEVNVSNSTTKAGIPGDNVGKIFCPSSRKGCLRSYAVTWSPDGKSLASVSGDRTVRIWDPSTGQLKWTMKELKGHT